MSDIVALIPAALRDIGLVADLAIAAALGLAVGKVLVRLREARDGRELEPHVVRRIEVAWMAVGVVMGIGVPVLLGLF